jgi:hypothetical protein
MKKKIKPKKKPAKKVKKKVKRVTVHPSSTVAVKLSPQAAKDYRIAKKLV